MHLFDREDGEPVAGDDAQEGDGEVSEGRHPEVAVEGCLVGCGGGGGGDVVEGVLDVIGGVGHAEGIEEVGMVEGDTAEGNIEEKPGERGADQDLEVLPLGAVFVELLGGVSASSLRDFGKRR